MPLKKIKQFFLNTAEHKYSLKLLLTMFLYLKSDVRKPAISKVKIIRAFIFHFISNILDNIIFSFFKQINNIRELRLILILRKKIIHFFPFLRSCFYKIDLPVNLKNSKDIEFFRHRNYFFLKPSVLKRATNSYLYLETYFGIIFKKLRINNASIHGKFDKRSKEILSPYNKIIFKNYIIKVFHKNETVITPVKDTKYLLIHHWFNYYHWFTESIYRFFSVDESFENYTLVLPDTFKTIDFVQDSLKALSVKSISYFKNGSILHFDELYYITQKKYCDNYDPKILQKIKLCYKDYIIQQNIESPIKNNKIFILRKSEYARSIINIDQVCALLKQYDFALVDFEAYSFYEQVAIMQQTKFLAATHGAGLTNMMFMPENSSVFELHKEIKTKTDHHSLVYFRLAGTLRHKYFFQFCEYNNCKVETENENRKNNVNFELHSFYLKVDVDLLEYNLKLFLKSDE